MLTPIIACLIKFLEVPHITLSTLVAKIVTISPVILTINDFGKFIEIVPKLPINLRVKKSKSKSDPNQLIQS